MTSNNCILQKVPANMIHHLQPLDISINGLAKQFMRNKYKDWYVKNIVCQLNGGVSSENVKVDTRLTKFGRGQDQVKSAGAGTNRDFEILTRPGPGLAGTCRAGIFSDI